MEHLLISDAAKEVQVESHVLRYWEEELKLPIKRNEVGHRYYTDKDIERFKQIKVMKERGLQLKAIKMILKDGKLDVLPDAVEENEGILGKEHGRMAIEVVEKREITIADETKEEKAQRLQWLLKQLFKETLEENNKELSKEIRESMVKELDYQFRCQEERELERNKERDKRDEEYYQRMDDLLRKKTRRLKTDKAEKHERFKKAARNLEKQINLELGDVNWAETDIENEEKKIKEGSIKEKKALKVVKGNKSPKLISFKKKRHLL